MKSWKRLLALLIAILIAMAVFASCGGNSESSSGSSSSEASASSETESSEANSEVSSEAESSGAGDGTVHPMRWIQPGDPPHDEDTVMAAVNEKLKEDGVDIEVEVITIPWDSYDQKLNVMLATGEPFELLQVMQDVKNLSSIASMGAIISLHDYLLDKYQDLYNKFSDKEWKGVLFQGEEYAVPSWWRSLDNAITYINWRKDVGEKVGYSEFPETTDEIIDLMKKSQDYIKEETGQMAYHWMHQNQDTAHWLHRSYDTYPFYVENTLGIALFRQDGTIDSFYESDEFRQDAETYQKMYDMGLIDPDILSYDSQKKYNDAEFGAMLPSNTFDPDVTNKMRDNGVEGAEVEWVRTFPDKPDVIYTFVQNMNAISATSEDPESGLKFLNWLYSSEENHNLFNYGIEGVHYTVKGENRIEQTRNDEGGLLYARSAYMSGYLPYICYDSLSVDGHISFMTYESDNYVVSPAAGFIFDASPVQSQLTNIQAEIIASIYPIKFGMVSYEENIGPAIEKLKAAGLDEYLEEYRKQFAAYLEANPNVLEDAKGNTQG